jgi:hypothetical protein
LGPGTEATRTRQFGMTAGGHVRNSCADANVSHRQPSPRINSSSDSRTEASSSRINTIGVVSDAYEDVNPRPSTCAELAAYPGEIAAELIARSLVVFGLSSTHRPLFGHRIKIQRASHRAYPNRLKHMHIRSHGKTRARQAYKENKTSKSKTTMLRSFIVHSRGG